jgi:hypothetical protein
VSTGQGARMGVRLSRGRRSSGFEGKCAYGLGEATQGVWWWPHSGAGDGGRQGAPRAVACRLAGARFVRSAAVGLAAPARGAPARGPGERRCRLIRRFIWIFFFFSAGVSIMERLSSIINSPLFLPNLFTFPLF